MSDIVLEARDICMRFGGLLAVDHVSFEVRKNEIFAIIGQMVQVKPRYLIASAVFISQLAVTSR